MTLAGFPLYVFAPFVVSIILGILFVILMSALSKKLGVEPKNTADGKRLNAALYGGEMRLHDLGVHRTVWMIRLAFVGLTVSNLLFAYLVYRVTEAA